MADPERMDITDFVKLSTTLCTDMRRWIEQATLRGTLSEKELASLNAAADIIDATTTALAAPQVANAAEEFVKNPPLI